MLVQEFKTIVMERLGSRVAYRHDWEFTENCFGFVATTDQETVTFYPNEGWKYQWLALRADEALPSLSDAIAATRSLGNRDNQKSIDEWTNPLNWPDVCPKNNPYREEERMVWLLKKGTRRDHVEFLKENLALIAANRDRAAKHQYFQDGWSYTRRMLWIKQVPVCLLDGGLSLHTGQHDRPVVSWDGKEMD